jgi:hypothetical protein
VPSPTSRAATTLAAPTTSEFDPSRSTSPDVRPGGGLTVAVAPPVPSVHHAGNPHDAGRETLSSPWSWPAPGEGEGDRSMPASVDEDLAGDARADAPPARLLTTRALCRIFGCTPRTIRRWKAAGIIRAITVAGRDYYRLDDIERLGL